MAVLIYALCDVAGTLLLFGLITVIARLVFKRSWKTSLAYGGYTAVFLGLMAALGLLWFLALPRDNLSVVSPLVMAV